MHWAQNFQQLINLFLESSCPLCQRPTVKEFCRDCEKQLQPEQIFASTLAGKEKLPVIASGVYIGTLKRAITALKYKNQPQLALPLGHLLAKAWLNSHLNKEDLIVVPIPLHANKHKQRGYNQAALLAESFCNKANLQLQHLGLERVRETQSQFCLAARERENNLARAFQTGRGFRKYQPKKPVLLLDDIYTTGATARSAVQTLRQAGIEVRGLVALAASCVSKEYPTHKHGVYNERTSDNC